MKKIFLIVGLLSLLISVSFLLYPTVSNLINTIYNNSTIENYYNNVSTLDKNEKDKYLLSARNYNKKLADRVSNISFSTTAFIDGYDNILNFNGGIIGYVNIPKINVNLPIYHGTNESVLSEGAAHLPNTAFPVGGIGNHTVISAHTAYPGKVFFDDLPELENGDLIYINIIDETLTYKVCNINIVDPDNISFLQVDENRDLLSLVTCYPYAVNSHRLVVTAEHIENNSTDDERVPIQTTNYSGYIAIGVIFCICITVTIFVLVKRRKRRAKKCLLKIMKMN